MEVTLPGHVLRSHEHKVGAVAGWGAMKEGVWNETRARMLLYVLFSLSSMCC